MNRSINIFDLVLKYKFIAEKNHLPLHNLIINIPNQSPNKQSLFNIHYISKLHICSRSNMPQPTNQKKMERIHKSEKRRERATQAHTAHCIDWFEHKKNKDRGSDKQRLQQLAADRKFKKGESSCQEEDIEFEVQTH